MEDVIVPVLEMAVYAASRYANACGRSTVTSTDMKYGMCFATRHTLGNQIGSYLSDESESDSEESDESDWVTDTEEEFTRYDGTDEDILRMNRAYDEWDSWVPETIAEIMLKRAVDGVMER